MTSQGITDRRPNLVDAQAAVRRFLQESLPEVHRVDVTRVTALASAESAWEAEAVVWQPNAAIAALGLPTRRPVLDQTVYLVRLDSRLDIIEYETKQPEREP